MRRWLRDPRILVLASAALLGAAVAFPLGVVASHQFTDVPTSSTYHDDIDAIRDAGVTTGCAVGKYCPKDFVTREQMAAFLNRLGALGPGKTPVINATKLDGKDSTQFARSDVAATGVYNCIGRAMIPGTAGVAWATLGPSIYVTSGGGFVSCPVRLPQGATVVAIRAHVLDSSATEWLECALGRFPMGATGGTPMAELDSGESAMPGTTMLESTDITDPVVDNTAVFYSAFCEFNGSGTDTRVHGLSIEYTSSGVPLD